MDTYTQPITPKRQYRSLELKQRIVEETLAEGASVALVARAHGVNANQVFTWRRQYRAGRLGERAGANLLPVRVTPESSPSLRTTFLRHGSMPSSSAGTIHIQLNHAQVSLEGSADPELLRVLLECLQR
jgi:transposase